MNPDGFYSAMLKCCRLSNGRTATAANVNVTGVSGNGVTANSNNNFGNLAKCNNENGVVTGFCASDGSKRCNGAAVSVDCATVSGMALNNHTTTFHSSNGEVSGVSSITENGCHLVNGDEFGQWAHCGAGEVLVGACGSGSNKDCFWGSKDHASYNQAMCCPVK
jgi:hypothetical protein